MKTHLAATLLVAAASIHSAAVQAQQPRYRATFLSTPGYDSTLAWDISDGAIVGSGNLLGLPPTPHALLWTSQGGVVDLHPAGYQSSVANAASGALQGGSGGNPIPNDPFGLFLYHALLWQGTAESVVDLHPAGFVESSVTGMAGEQQVGYGETDAGVLQALLWTGSADSVVSLHPAGFRSSYAEDTSGTMQVGNGARPGESIHALLWNGTAESVVDLNPVGWDGSVAYGAAGATQVGVALGIPDPSSGLPVQHAFLWTGSAESGVDLHPRSGFAFSTAYDVAGDVQVGSGYHAATQRNHALAWRGSATSVVDLHRFVATQLGARYVESEALAVDASGDIVGFAWDENFEFRAVTRSLVPEPASWSLLACGLACWRGLVLRRRG